ncbi:glycosyltransferase family 9 protein [Dyadobacter sandarakinus]|uniref:Glycosyltransferase family 9 protein n=2 Tax=Dyadobacter sandarakinus TaxID=2747268 RepID=A0ABX7IG74_9BACT|nr:glycosyltransferase family 9 protein [Dyadobacter sandarakinus]
MTPTRFVQLWTHRYHKYTHILKAHGLGYMAWLHFQLVKWRTGGKKKLVAVIRTEHFGDIVTAEPISRYLRTLYPDSYIVWFVKPAFRELVSANPSIDEVFAEFCVTQRQTLLKTGIFDQVHELQFSNNNHCPVCQVFVDNPVAVGRHINIHNYFNYGNLLEVFAQTGDLIPERSTFPADDQPRLYLLDKHRSRVNALGLPERFIVVHCRSNYAPKDWPHERWEQLIDWLLLHYECSVVEVGLSSNLEITAPGYINLCGKLSIPETAEVIRRAELFAGLDSGPSHLANASGVFGIILMGSLNEFPTYNPYCGSYGRQENAVFVRQPGVPCAALPFEFVKEKIAAVLDNRLVNNTSRS